MRDVVWSAASRIALYGLCDWELQDHWILLSRVTMHLRGLGREFDGARVAHLSDLHCGPIMTDLHLRRYVDVVNRARPDFVVLTGDFITHSGRSCVRKVADVLADLSPRRATLAVLGNHDHGLWHPDLHNGAPGLGDYVAERLDRAGVDVLRNASRTFRRGSGVLHFAGVRELWTGRYDAAEAFDHIPRGEPAVALCHNPDAAEHLALMGASYVLAGHTHGKRVGDTRWGRCLFPTQCPQFVAGRYALDGGGMLYVNRGLGPARRAPRNRRPEITLFTLRPAERTSDARLRRPADRLAPADAPAELVGA